MKVAKIIITLLLLIPSLGNAMPTESFEFPAMKEGISPMIQNHQSREVASEKDELNKDTNYRVPNSEQDNLPKNHPGTHNIGKWY